MSTNCLVTKLKIATGNDDLPILNKVRIYVNIPTDFDSSTYYLEVCGRYNMISGKEMVLTCSDGIEGIRNNTSDSYSNSLTFNYRQLYKIYFKPGKYMVTVQNFGGCRSISGQISSYVTMRLDEDWFNVPDNAIYIGLRDAYLRNEFSPDFSRFSENDLTYIDARESNKAIININDLETFINLTNLNLGPGSYGDLTQMLNHLAQNGKTSDLYIEHSKIKLPDGVENYYRHNVTFNNGEWEMVKA